MNNNIKNYKDYENRLVVADSSPLIFLYNAGKLDYLKLLFKDVYTTETVKKECKRIVLPEWIKIEEPNENTKKTVIRKGIDKGEGSALGLIIEIDARNKFNLVGNRTCLILDDKEANYEIKKLNLNIETIGLKHIFKFALDKKLCSKEELKETINILSKKGRIFKNDDIEYMLGEVIKVGKKK